MKKSAMICSLGVATTLSMGIFAVTNPVMAESLLPLNRNTNGTSAEVKVKVTVVGQAPSVVINAHLMAAITVTVLFPLKSSILNQPSWFTN